MLAVCYSLNMGKTHKEQLQLKAELKKAMAEVEIGSNYYHYKGKHKIYKVLHLAFQEENDVLCVVYQAVYDERLVFIRPLASWLQTVEAEGKLVPRFTRI